MDATPQVASRAVAVGSRRRRPEGRRPERLPGEPRRVGYLYVLPAFLLYAAFVLVPLGHAIYVSFFDWDGLTPGTWVGSAELRGDLQRTPRSGPRSSTWFT